MEPNHVTNTITEYLSPYFNNSDLDLFALNRFLLIMFKNNIFTFNKKFYIQKSGLAMGSSCGPMVANLYLFIMEKKIKSCRQELARSQENFIKILVLI